MGSKLKKLKFEPKVQEFLKQKSKNTAQVYASGLSKFLNFYRAKYGKDANFNHFLTRIFEEFKKPPLEQDHIVDPEINEFIDFLKDKGLSNNSIRLYFAAVQNFLKWNKVIVSMDFIKVPPQIEKEENEKHEWKIEHIKQFVDSAKTYRDKAIIMCMFQSGLAVQEICNLNYGDIKDELEAGILPLCLKLVRQKTGSKFKTFFGRDAVKYLKIYLATRKNLKPKSPLFTKQRARGGEMRITPTIIQQSFSEIAKKLDFIELEKDAYNPARPHSLRAAFNSRLFTIDETLREFWMGHDIGAVKKAYLTMPTEEMRKHYMSAEQYLKIEMTSQEEKEEKAKAEGSVTAEMKRKMRVLEQRLGDMAVLEKKVESLETLFKKTFEMKPEELRVLLQEIDRLLHQRQKEEDKKQMS